jgi:hypothetical protein
VLAGAEVVLLIFFGIILFIRGKITLSKSICPYCGAPGISLWRKFCHGPFSPATCQVCGREAAVPQLESMLSAIPFLLGFFGPPALLVLLADQKTLHTPPWEMWWFTIPWVIVALIGISVSFLIFLRWVPLVRK